ncbi:MAG: rRNA pseudouridine synthase [Erysipelothrix sp.]|nr:rRNA pseudouridine synthase [Erysipelothrix sp.]
MASSKEIRLQKAIAMSGVASRRKAETMIEQGRVKVNGQVVRELGTKVLSEDRISVDGKDIMKEDNFVYYLLNKPRGYVSTAEDQFDRPTVLDLVKDQNRLFPVGRLDMDTTGAIILTNDGHFTQLLTHPSYEMSKTYRVSVEGILDYDVKNALKAGVQTKDTYYQPMEIKRITHFPKKNRTAFDLILHEGKNRQIRNLMEHFNLPVIRLHRYAIGELKLDELSMGQYRRLKPFEVQKLKEQAEGKY